LANFKNDTHITFDGYTFNPEIAWPRISIKPNYFTSYLSYTKRSNCRQDAYIKNSDGSETRIICSTCKTLLTSQEIIDGQTKCNSCQNLTKNKQHGILSDNSKKRLQCSFDWLVLLSQQKKAYNEKLCSWYNFKIAMVTVKLPCEELHDDLYIKKNILNNFLTQLRTKYNVNMYIWRAERGDDSILHFHIITDQFLPHDQINKIWNKILDSHGYIEQYRTNQKNFHKDGFKFNENHSKHWDRAAQIKAYKKGMATNWNCPTGTTDVHSVRKIRNTKAYLAKYISKPSDIKKKSKMMFEKKKKKIDYNRLTGLEKFKMIKEIIKKFQIEGNLWYISQSLSRLKSILVDVDQTLSDLCHKIFIETPSNFFQSEYCRIFKIGIREIISKKFTPLIDAIRASILDIRAKYYPVNSRIFSTLGIPLQLNF
jgi:hypothetical protein